MRYIIPTIFLAAIFFLGRMSAPAQAPVNPLAHLTQLSEREFVDLSKVSYIRYAAVIDFSGVCDPDYVQRSSDWMIVDGGPTGISGGAEDKLRQIRGDPPALTAASCVPKNAK